MEILDVIGKETPIEYPSRAAAVAELKSVNAVSYDGIDESAYWKLVGADGPYPTYLNLYPAGGNWRVKDITPDSGVGW